MPNSEDNLPQKSYKWSSIEDAKYLIRDILHEMLKDTNYYVNFGEHLKKSDPNSLYVHKNGFRYSVLHIYPKTGNDNGKMDLVVIKQVFEYLQKTVPSSWRLLEDKGTQGYDLITVDELKHYVQLLLNSPEIETMLKTKKK